MTRDVIDAVIIGCGAAGAWTALFLAEAGVRCTVIERERPGAGASSKGSGMSRVHYRNRAELRLAHLAQPYYRDWARHVGIGSCGWRDTGWLLLLPPEDVEASVDDVRAQVAIGSEARIVLAPELAMLQPHLDLDGVGGAVHEPGSGTVIGAHAMLGLASRLLALGVDLRTYTQVTRVLHDGTKVMGVTTTEGSIAAGIVVLAAGAWSARLATEAGLDVPLAPIRASVGTSLYPPSIDPAMALYDGPLGFSFAPRSGGSWAITPVRDEGFLKPADPESFDASPGWNAVVAGQALITRRIPAMREARPLERWAAVDGCTPDGLPIIGPHPLVQGLYMHVGGNFKGFKVAPGGARALVDKILGGNPAVDLEPFSLDRFRADPSMGIPDVQGQLEHMALRWT